MRTYNAGTHFGLLLIRITIGLYLILAGWGKVTIELDKGIGFFYKEAYLKTAPDWLPGWFNVFYGYSLPWLEVLVGGLVVVGLFTRFFGAGGFLMLLSFTIVKVMANGKTGLGDDERGIFSPNYLMTVSYFLLIFTGAGALSLDRVFFGKRKAKAKQES